MWQWQRLFYRPQTENNSNRNHTAQFRKDLNAVTLKLRRSLLLQRSRGCSSGSNIISCRWRLVLQTSCSLSFCVESGKLKSNQDVQYKTHGGPTDAPTSFPPSPSVTFISRHQEICFLLTRLLLHATRETITTQIHKISNLYEYYNIYLQALSFDIQ